MRVTRTKLTILALLSLGTGILLLQFTACNKAKLTGPSSGPTIAGIAPEYLVAGSQPETLVITGTGFYPFSSVTFNGTAHSASLVSSTEMDVPLNQTDLATPGTYTIAVSNAGPFADGTVSTTFNVWNTFQDTSGITFAFPQFGGNTQVATNAPLSGIASSFDINGWSSTAQELLPLVAVTIYPNTSGESLQDWFENAVDINGILMANNTFQAVQLKNGVNALIIAGSVPGAYLDVGSPV